MGSFCNGTRWVLKHLFNGYDGTAYFRERGGERFHQLQRHLFQRQNAYQQISADSQAGSRHIIWIELSQHACGCREGLSLARKQSPVPN